MLPQLTPATGLGSAAVAAYAARAGVTVADYLSAAGPALSTEQVGAAVTSLVTDARLRQGRLPAHRGGA